MKFVEILWVQQVYRLCWGGGGGEEGGYIIGKDPIIYTLTLDILVICPRRYKRQLLYNYPKKNLADQTTGSAKIFPNATAAAEGGLVKRQQRGEVEYTRQSGLSAGQYERVIVSQRGAMVFVPKDSNIRPKDILVIDSSPPDPFRHGGSPGSHPRNLDGLGHGSLDGVKPIHSVLVIIAVCLCASMFALVLALAVVMFTPSCCLLQVPFMAPVEQIR
ncbi:uncharacterized protein LOC142354192 [Convolutriloba macropyga]|uniref:uncharacterized protein LOC142354192 n=1 Tax=Convolutriloba macropyga TaxID=536237 RepID=UPI003F51C08C